METVSTYLHKLKHDVDNINYLGKLVIIITAVLLFDLFMVVNGSIFAHSLPIFAVILSWVWFMLPGLILSYVLVDRVHWWERIPISFVINVGLVTPITLAAILLRVTVDTFLYSHFLLLMICSFILFLRKRRSYQVKEVGKDDQKSASIALKSVINPLLITAIIISSILVVLSRQWPLFGDEIAGLSIFSEVIQQGKITGTEPFHGTDVPVTPRNELIVWTYNEIFTNYVSNAAPTDFIINTRPILVTLALLSLGTLLNQFLKDRYQVLFLFNLWGIYLLANMQADATGSDFITRIIQDKFFGWLVVIPILIVFVLRFIESETKTAFIGFAIVAFGASMVHPITLTHAMILSAGFGLIHFLVEPNRKSFRIFFLIALTLAISTIIPFYQFIRFNDYSPVVLAGLGDAVEFGRLSASIGRYRLWMLGEGRYILHPSVILIPVIIAAYVLLPWMIFQIRKSYFARLIVGTLLILPVLLYTAPFAALAGRVVTPYLIWRLAWPFPLFAVFTVGFLLWAALEKVSDRWKINNDLLLMKNIIYPSLIIVTLLISLTNIQEGMKNFSGRQAIINTSTCITAKNVLDYLDELASEESVNVLSSHNLNYCIPGYAALANVVEFRGYGTVNRLSEENLEESLERVEDVNYFNVARYLDDLLVNAVERHGIDYILLEKERLELDFQLKYSPDIFELVYDDADYSLYAVNQSIGESNIILGNTALRRNQFEEAIQIFNRILKVEPTNVLALTGLGVAQAASGQNNLSAAAFQEAINYAPGESILHAQLASTLVLKKDTLSAIKEYLQAINLSPNRYTLYVGLGQVYILAGNLEDAHSSFEQAAALRSIKDTASYYTELGRMYQSVNMVDEAIKYYEKALSIEVDTTHYIPLARAKFSSGDVDGAIDIYRQSVAFDRWSYLPHLDLGSIYLDQGRVDDAIAELEFACQLRPTNVSAYILLGQAIQQKSGLDAAIRRLEEMKNISNVLPGPSRGMAALWAANGEYEKALEELMISENIQPKSVAILIAQGYVAVAQGKTDQALEDFNQALLYHPDLITARLGLSLLYTNESEYDMVTNQFIQIVRLSPLSAWTHLNLAQSFEQQGNWDRAHEEIEIAITLEPNNAQVYIVSGDFNKTQLNYDQAILDYQKALELDPNNTTALIGLGETYRELVNYSEAEKMYKRAVKAEIDAVLPKLKLMELYWQMGRYEEVEALEQDAIKLAPDSNLALIKLADIYRMQGRIDEAKELYERAIEIDPYEIAAFSVLAQLLIEEDSDESSLLAIYNNMLRVNPESAEAYMTVGQFYAGQGQFETAEEVLQRSLNFSDVSAENYLLLSSLQQKRGDQQSALLTLKTAEELFPEKVVVLTALGEYYLKSGNTGEAESYFSKAIVLDPNTTNAYVGLSSIAQINGDFQQAEKILLDAVLENSESPKMQLALANFLETIGRIDEAEENLIKASSLVPSDIDTQMALGEFYLRRNRNAEAMAIFQNTLNLPHSKLDVYLAIGDLYVSDRSIEEAIDWYQKAGLENRSDVRPYVSLAKLYQSIHEWDKALDTLNAALVIEPANLEVNLALGELYQRTGINRNAITYFEQATKIDRNNITSLISLAEFLKENGSLDLAVNYLQQALDLSKTGSTVYTALAKTYLLLGDISQAESILSQSVQNSIDKDQAYIARAIFYEGKGSWDLAQDDYQTAYSLFPSSRIVGLTLVDFLSRRNELDKALEILDQLEMRIGTNAEISAMYGKVYTLQAKWEDAENAYQQAIDLDPNYVDGYLGLARVSEIRGDVAESVNIYKTAAANIPDDKDVLINLARALQSQGMSDEARKVFQDILVIEPLEPVSLLSIEQLNSIEGDSRLDLWALIRIALEIPSAEAYNTIAQIYLFRGEWDLAYEWLERAVNLKPYDSRYLMYLAEYYRMLGQWEEAQETYQQALKYSQDPLETLIGLGSVQEELGLIEDARVSYQRAIDTDPGSIDGYLALAKLNYRIGETQQALLVVNQGIAKSPGGYRGYQMLGDLYTGIDEENLSQAEEAYLSGLKVIPGSPQLHTSIADLYTKRYLALKENLDAIQSIELLAQNRVQYLIGLQGSELTRQQERVTQMKLEEAMLIYNAYQVRSKTASQEYEQASEFYEIALTNYLNALKILPNHEASLIGMGKLQIAHGSMQDAIKYFDQALAVNPHSTLALSYLGSINLDLEQPLEAIKYFERIIAYEPENLFAHLGLSIAYRDLPDMSISQAADSAEQGQYKLQSWVEYLRLVNN